FSATSITVTQIIIDFIIILILDFFIPMFHIIFILSFTFHLVLTSIFLNRKISFIICCAAIIFASLTMWYSFFFNSSGHHYFFELYQKNLFYIILFHAGIAAAFTGVWFLTTEMSLNLRNRETILKLHYDKMLNLDKEKAKIILKATHELKAPLAAITSRLYTIREGYTGNLNNKTLETVNKTIERTNMVSAKITDIIKLGNLKTSMFSSSHFKTVNLKKIITSIISDFKINAAKRNIKIEHKLAPGSEKITAISDQIYSLVLNLLSNAINYSRDNGKVQLHCSRENENIKLQIIDNGIGIYKEGQQYIFDEYYRTREAVKHNPNSSGLGLAIVKEIINLHKGNIDIK
ncbi:MAG TPA: HAMP domain-containing sensor histidine kinase, partial [Spirochaetota bacterium]|nr:HAMP domain-containing sensor histidine kinase [Spirochaetota bacterium]